MASQQHFVAIGMTPNTCHSWWFAGLFTLTVTVAFQLSLLSEIIASEKGGAGNTDNIRVWSLSIHGSFTDPLFDNIGNCQRGQDVHGKG